MLAGCGRVSFDPRTDAALTGDDAPLGDAAPSDTLIDAVVDAPMFCTTIPCSGTSRFSSCGPRCFVTCEETLNQGDATARCNQWGGALVSIHSANEVSCLNTIAGTGSVWIGYTQATGATSLTAGWSWTDGSSPTYVNWAGGEPSDGDGAEDGTEQCGHIYPGGGWNDRPCSSTVISAFGCAR
jgi:hypothetical protein